MTNEIKVYYPDTIEDQPLTSVAVEVAVSTGSSSAKKASETVTIEPSSTFPPKPIPIPVVAQNLVSDSLNTQSRQILSSFTFGKVGALQVGSYVDGVSGDIRISPNGIVARNSAGVTTVSIDGTTGNATFLGTIASGSVISASVSANLITGTILNAQIASIDWAKITNVVIDWAQIQNVVIQWAQIQDVSVTNAQIESLSASKINTGTLTGINIVIGSGNSIFKADSNGIYLGNSSYGSAPFRVNPNGDVVATSITLRNALVSTNSTWEGNIIASAYIGSLTAGHITSGTIYVGGTSQPDALVIGESVNTGNSKFRFQRGSRMWEDNTSRLGINSIGSPMIVYVDSYEVMVVNSNNPNNSALGRSVKFTGGIQLANGRGMYFWDNTSQYIAGASNAMLYKTNSTGDHMFYQGGTVRCIIDDNIWCDNNIYADGSFYTSSGLYFSSSGSGANNKLYRSGNDLYYRDNDGNSHLLT